VLEEILEEMEDFTHGRYNLAKGVFLGETFSFIEGERRPIKIGGKVQNWWIPRRLRDIDKRRIRMRPTWDNKAPDGGKIRAHYELFNLEKLDWVPIRPDSPLVHFKYDDEESRLSHGRGVAEAIYFHHYAKGVVFTEGLEGLEKWARGMIVAKVDNAQATALTNETTAAAYLTQLERQRRGGIMVMDTADELEVKWPDSQGNDMVFQWLQYLDAGIVTVILGQVIPQSGGALIAEALTRAITEAGSSETLLGYDRTVLYEMLTRDLVGHIWYWNRPQLAELGLTDAKRPFLRAAAIDDTDPKEAIDIIATARTAGIPLLKDEVYDRIGFSRPGANDDIFEPILDPGAAMATDEDGKPVPNKMANDPVGNVKGPAAGASAPPSRPTDHK